VRPRIKAVCPVCGRDLECDVKYVNADSDVTYTIVVSPAGRAHINSHL
jgi:hypothetical protein